MFDVIGIQRNSFHFYSAELAEELMNLDDNESKTNGKTSPEPDSESEVRFNDTIHDGDGSDEEKRSKQKTIKRYKFIHMYI